MKLHQHSQILFLKLIPHHKYRKARGPLAAYTLLCLFVDQKLFGHKYPLFTTTLLHCTFSSKTFSNIFWLTFPLMSNPTRPCMFIYCTCLRIRRIRQSLNLLSTLCLHTPLTSLYVTHEKESQFILKLRLSTTYCNANWIASWWEFLYFRMLRRP